jgi:hypothetical protein
LSREITEETTHLMLNSSSEVKGSEGTSWHGRVQEHDTIIERSIRVPLGEDSITKESTSSITFLEARKK